MQPVKAFEPGAMFWIGRETLAELQHLGLRCGQLGVGGGVEINEGLTAQWKRDLQAANFAISTVVVAYDGEDYADIPTVQRTVGFVPPATRAAREQRTYAVSDFGAALGIRSLATHIGFVPEDPADADYIGVRDMVRRVCDHAAANGQTFALETGQERAEVLLGFIRAVDRPNLKINFDPANMILYGTGDPIEALRLLAPHVVSVHCKDGDWPPKDVPGALGTERPFGQGAVGVDRFVRTLKEIGYKGQLNIEREGTDHATWLHDVGAAAKRLRSLAATLPES
jgi:sugar phosphate isomerase/epimerase